MTKLTIITDDKPTFIAATRLLESAAGNKLSSEPETLFDGGSRNVALSGAQLSTGYEQYALGTGVVSASRGYTVIDLRGLKKLAIKLNDEYSAEVRPDKSVKVGCQTFSREAILKLAEAVR